MGNFYTNITLLGPTQRDVAECMCESRRECIVSPTKNDTTIVWDCASEAQDDGLYRLADYLSGKFNCTALAVMNHDDSVLYYRLYVSGKELDSYNSSPNYFDGPPRPPAGGNARILCDTFHVPQSQAQVDRLLREGMEDAGASKYVFEIDRHLDLVNALKLPDWAVATGFKYLTQGDWPPGLNSTDCISVGGECSELMAVPTWHPLTTDGIPAGLVNVGVIGALIIAYVLWRRWSRVA